MLKRFFIILILMIGLTSNLNAQNPPRPGRGGPPCDPGVKGNGSGNGQGVPPPVGLCLPIDDYVYILMAVGVMYGCYKVRKFDLT